MRAVYEKIPTSLTRKCWTVPKTRVESWCVWHVKRSATRLAIVQPISVWVHRRPTPHQAGHLKFTHAALDRYKKNAASVIPFRCVDCTGQTTAQRGQKRPIDASTPKEEKRDNYDVKSLLHTLRQKNSWRCTCKTTQPAQKMKAKSAIAGKSHDPKCMLQRTFFGERRWDGKNLGITLEQLQYLADRNLY